MTAIGQPPGTTASTNGKPTSPGGRHASQQASPQDRGTLEVAPTVVRKVAERAADLTPGTLPAPRRVAGLGAGHQGARARVDSEGSTVDVALELALRYPAPVRDLCETVRNRVSGEVHRITGYRVRSVRITVCALLPETHPRVE